MNDADQKSQRRKVLKNIFAVGAGTLFLGTGSGNTEPGPKSKKTEKVKVLTTEGKVIEVERPENDCKIQPCQPAKGEEARKGIPGRSFVMVIDLAKCKNARKCIEGCQKGHNLSPDQEWLNVFLMKDHKDAEPYWFPRQCFHCDNPPCVKVCPVGATYKRQDNLVLVDVNRCIGCKFCIVACPYSVRIFNWDKPLETDLKSEEYSPETSVPAQIGTIGKCDFCPDRSREGKLPYCVEGCPMGAMYFGDKNEDAVSNGTETLRFKKLIKDRVGYRYLEELGTEPNVYYLPPVERMFDYKSGLKDVPDDKRHMYEEIIEGNHTKRKITRE